MVYTVCIFCYKFIIKRTVCCKLITRRAVCRNLLTDAAGLLQNARFVRIAKDHIRPPRLYSSRRFAANRNNQPKKKNPDEYSFFFTKVLDNFIGSDRDTLKLNFNILSRVGSPKIKLSLKPFKSYSLLTF